MDVKQLLDELAEAKSQIDALELEKRARLAQAIPDDVKAAIEAIETDIAARQNEAAERAANIEAQVKAAVIENGATVKGAYLMAVWNKGRVSWDSKKLDGMMALIPALADARTQGEPSVTIRAVK